MPSYHVEDIRNIALVGHGAGGKTSLADALLFEAKSVDRRGSVEDGTSVSGFLCEAHATTGARDISTLGGWRNYLASSG